MDDWKPDYVKIYQWRQQQLIELSKSPALVIGAKEYYKNNCIDFIEHWCDTYDPRNALKSLPTTLPFQLFPKQRELVDFVLACLNQEANGLLEKSRDMGATWVCVSISVWLWLFYPGTSVGWGSRKEILVDRLGDPSSIFEKIRMLIERLPLELLPKGFDRKKHFSQMKVINPETGSTIIGECGDNIGRGGRTLVYFKDESAHYEHPEKIEAALGDNTNVQIDVSSVHGVGNVFHRKREAGWEWTGGKTHKGVTNVFIMDWTDHPYKNKEWYDYRKNKAETEGVLHLFAQEVDRDYSSAIEGIIIPGKWVAAAIDAHIKLDFDDDGPWIAGLDVADEGGDRNALAFRKGVVLKQINEWGNRDTGKTARKAVEHCEDKRDVSLQYDCIGVGAGVKAESNRLIEDGKMPNGVTFIAWSGAASPLNKDKPVIVGDNQSPLIKDFYKNLKSQGWWELRARFEKTFKAITEGETYPVDELISLSSDIPLIRTVQKELSQPTASKNSNLQLIVDKKPEGTKSPNIGDAIMMAYWPVKRNYTLNNL